MSTDGRTISISRVITFNCQQDNMPWNAAIMAQLLIRRHSIDALLSICSSVCLSVCLSVAKMHTKTRFSQKLSSFKVMVSILTTYMCFSKNPLLNPLKFKMAEMENREIAISRWKIVSDFNKIWYTTAYLELALYIV